MIAKDNVVVPGFYGESFLIPVEIQEDFYILQQAVDYCDYGTELREDAEETFYSEFERYKL
jgi:hypothetical protein